MTGKIKYECKYCDFHTTEQRHYNSHLYTLNHDIAENGIVCCGVTFTNRAIYVRHKKTNLHCYNILGQLIPPDEDPDDIFDVKGTNRRSLRKKMTLVLENKKKPKKKTLNPKEGEGTDAFPKMSTSDVMAINKAKLLAAAELKKIPDATTTTTTKPKSECSDISST
jgi:hypothetical protein